MPASAATRGVAVATAAVGLGGAVGDELDELGLASPPQALSSTAPVAAVPSAIPRSVFSLVVRSLSKPTRLPIARSSVGPATRPDDRHKHGPRLSNSILSMRHSDAVASVTHPAVRDALAGLGIEYEVVPCDPALADTAAFCAAYGFDPQDAANCLVVASRRPAGRHLVALVLATTRLDVNGRCCELMGVRRASFAPLEETATLTGMEIGGVTPFGLPEPLLPVRVDAAVLRRGRVVVGGGDRSVKLVVDAGVFAGTPLFDVVQGLAAAAGEPPRA